ncbi:MAG: MBOAT family O-acyltransferase [Bacteroidia bacterium]
MLLIASILFYSWGAPRFIFVILGTTLLDFFLVRFMHRAKELRSKRLILLLSVSVNVGLLFYFKYSNFFIENVNVLLHALGFGEVHWTRLLLPIGISFYTFETVTYVVDVYRGVHKPLDHFGKYLLYIILFPKLIAGPIIRYHEIADQLDDRSAADTFENRLGGLYRFALGLGKKMLIANAMGATADEVFGMEASQLSVSAAWTGALAYTFHIYFDFSGYSDMAIGLGKIFGFRFPENFSNPYTSASITEFWRRWHMTLGSWMRNYLYIPLGGNRVSTARLYFNLWLVFLLSGLWHGAAWTFVIWGVWHGIFLVLERAFLLRVYEKTGKWISVPVTFVLVVTGWVFFRADDVHQATAFIQSMVGAGSGALHVIPDKAFLITLIPAVVFSFFCLSAFGEKIQQKVYNGVFTVRQHIPAVVIMLLLFILSLSYAASGDFNPFIYFRF